jgi:branched-chain amino acid transport system ATP-binding protein
MNILEVNIPEAGYGKKIVIKNVTLSVEEGEVVALIGPNGAGKSTILKLLIGIVKNPQGKIHLNGKSLNNLNTDLIVRHGISFVPQGNRVFAELSVKENLEMGGYLLKDKSTLLDRTEEVLNVFPDLKDRMKQDAGKLSGGEKQQLALARALMLKPKILLLDEPSLGLSPKLVLKAFETIQDVNKNFKTTILIVEQKVREVLRIVHRVYGLRMGEIVFTGIPSELQNGEELKKIFLI